MWKVIGGQQRSNESFTVLAKDTVAKRDIPYCVNRAIVSGIRSHPDQCVALEAGLVAVVRVECPR